MAELYMLYNLYFLKKQRSTCIMVTEMIFFILKEIENG
jgi:hypothetical protein